MPYKMSDRKQAEEDLVKHESVESKKEKLGERIMALEKERRQWLISGKSSEESQEGFVEKLFDNIISVMKLMDQYQNLDGNPENLMSERELARFFVKNGVVQLAKESKFNRETAKKAYAPLKAKLRVRGYWDPVAAKASCSGVKTSWKVPVKLEQRQVNTLGPKFDGVSDSMDRATGIAEGIPQTRAMSPRQLSSLSSGLPSNL